MGYRLCVLSVDEKTGYVYFKSDLNAAVLTAVYKPDKQELNYSLFPVISLRDHTRALINKPMLNKVWNGGSLTSAMSFLKKRIRSYSYERRTPDFSSYVYINWNNVDSALEVTYENGEVNIISKYSGEPELVMHYMIDSDIDNMKIESYNMVSGVKVKGPKVSVYAPYAPTLRLYTSEDKEIEY